MIRFTTALLFFLNAHHTKPYTDAEVPKNQKECVDMLRSEGFIKSEEVAKVMMQVDLKDYVTLGNPYDYNPKVMVAATTVAPTHWDAYSLETLKNHLLPGKRVLDISFGNGYLSVCMALMVGQGRGYVVGVEHLTDEVDFAIEAVNKTHPHLLAEKRVRFIGGQDVYWGAPDYGPYDVIHVGVVTTLPVPKELLYQLKRRARMMIPILTSKGAYMRIIDKLRNGTLVTTEERGIFHSISDSK